MPKLDRRTFFSAIALTPVLARAAANAPPSYAVQTIEPVWIPVSAGINLAGRIWLPDAPAGDRFPVVLEYIPYRTFDRYRQFDDYWGHALAQRGIAFARVDIRGSGNSEGVLTDEYLESEQQDAIDIIAWLAAQRWCTGAVGMRGISWGGFATLQVASRQPPALKAIMPMCASDMRFRNDAHYVGGLPSLTNMKWAAGFELVMASPPDPAVVGSRWEDMWRKRLDAAPSIAARWLGHDTNDAYWRHGSVGLNPQAIACPAYLVDGWADSYAGSALRLLAALRVPRKAIIGAWGHIYPQFGRPGPGLEWINEEERWWKHWLAGERTRVMDDPELRFHIGEATATQTRMADIPGHWAAEQSWPSSEIKESILHLAPLRLSEVPTSGWLEYSADKVVGLASPEWIPYAETELPREQSSDDARSLLFEMPIRRATDVVGSPQVKLRLNCNRPVAALAARLCEVDPEGRSWLISYGILNLSFRDGFNSPARRLKPGRNYDVTVELNPIAYRFKPGHIMRLALSESLLPPGWTSPERPTLRFDLADCSLALPVRPPRDTEPAMTISENAVRFPASNPLLTIEEKEEGGIHVKGAWPTSTSRIDPTNTELFGTGPDMDLSYDPADRDSCRWLVRQSSSYRREGWNCETRVAIEMTSNAKHFFIHENLAAFKDGKLFHEVRRSNRIARRYS